MKKLLLVLVALLMVSPAMADVTITAVDEGAGLVSINYAATGADADGLYSLISGMAINVSLTAGTMDIVPGSYKDDGESTNASPGYGIHPGSIQFDVNQQVTDYGDPVAPGTDPGALGDLPGSSCTLELGALYDDESVPSAQPLAAGTICQLQVSECTDVNLAVESVHRKGIVLEDGTNPTTVNLVGATDVYCAIDCWDFDCFLKGDANGDCAITFSDVSIVINAWPPLPYDKCADFSKDTAITFTDVSVLINSWPPNPNCDVSCVPIP